MKKSTSKSKAKLKPIRNFFRPRYFAMAIASIVLVMSAAIAAQLYSEYQEHVTMRHMYNTRLSRITAIYDAIGVPANYTLIKAELFGDKRPYPYDSSRSSSSWKSLLSPQNVDVTVAEMRARIEKAGFTFFEQPYPGAAQTELHFKSARNEYVRLNVSSKPRDDAYREMYQTGKAVSALTDMNFNQGPADVTLKVNLDDNNE